MHKIYSGLKGFLLYYFHGELENIELHDRITYNVDSCYDCDFAVLKDIYGNGCRFNYGTTLYGDGSGDGFSNLFYGDGKQYDERSPFESYD